MKKNNLLILIIFILISLFLCNWFQDDYKIITLLIEIPLFIMYIICFGFAIYNIVKKCNSIINYLNIILLITISLILFLFPFRRIKTKMELNLYEDDRNKVIEMIKNKKLKMDEVGNVKLPSKYKKLSDSGQVFVYLNNQEETVICFWIFRGMLSGSIELIYSSNGKSLIEKNMGYNQIEYIKKLNKDWYYVETSY